MGKITKATVKSLMRTLSSKKGLEILTLDVRECCSFTSFLILASGSSIPHLKTLQEALEKSLKKKKTPFKKEGMLKSGWIVLDAGDIVIHLLLKEKRAFYHLERLWGDAERIEM